METANSGKEVIDVAAYMDRDRGTVANKYSFVVFKDARGINWYGEPLNKCATIEAVMWVHSIQDKDVLFGGQLTRKRLDVNLVRVSLDDVYKLIISAYRVEQTHTRFLPLFVDAIVCINSVPSGVGSVRDLIRKSPWGF